MLHTDPRRDSRRANRDVSPNQLIICGGGQPTYTFNCVWLGKKRKSFEPVEVCLDGLFIGHFKKRQSMALCLLNNLPLKVPDSKATVS